MKRRNGSPSLSESDFGPLPIMRLRPDAVLPARAHAEDAGFDLVAVEQCGIEPGERQPVPTGIAVAVPTGHAGLVLPRSGLARKHGITVMNAPGLIDAGYRGEIVVTLINHGSERYAIAAGDRIAQLVVAPLSAVAAVEVDELPASGDGRDAGGFGSSGR